MKDGSEAESKECGKSFEEPRKRRGVQGKLPTLWLERLEKDGGVFSRSRQSRR